MTKPITKIQLTGFRGATGLFELDFDPSKDLTMLFGENGSGKSTILDAMDVVCNGTVGCLEGVSIGLAPGKYLCALGSPPGSLRVTVHSNGESWTGSMLRNAISVAGATAKPKVKILRRNRILELVMAQPSDRYKALSRFIDTAIVEQSEGSLQQKLADTDRSMATLIGDRDRMSTQLNSLWEAEGRPGPGLTATAWAEGKVTTGIANLNSQLDRVKAVVAAISNATAACSNYTMRTSTHDDLTRQLNAVEIEIAAVPGVSSVTAIRLLESLDKAKAFIEAEHSLDKCPTCQRPILRDQLLATVTHEFTQLSDLKRLSDRKNDVGRQLDVAVSHQQETKAELLQALRRVAEVTTGGDIPEIVALEIAWPSWTSTEQNMDSLTAICTRFETVQTSLDQQCEAAQRDVSQFNSTKEWWTGIKHADDQLVDLDRIRSGLQRAYDIVHENRVMFTQGILDGIRQEADRLFQLIHPGENIGLNQLKMEEARRGSVSQTSVFHGHADIPPQAVFSESHLDTLGFCVWLALAKRESPDQVILLIDDIFSSVDATHLGRVVDLLSIEAPNFLQVIVATHYRLWWDRCQNAQGIQRIHLGSWCVTNGIAAQNMPLVTQELRHLIGQPILDRQAVSSKAGILLESILDDLTLLYECSLPRNKQNLYTLGVLLTGCGKLFSRHHLAVQVNANWSLDGQPENWQPTAANAAYNRVNALQFIRNQVGCHFNAPGMEIPDSEVRDFGSATIGLIEALTCPNCGMLATKKAPDGTHLRCSCAKRPIRMTPVAIP